MLLLFATAVILTASPSDDAVPPPPTQTVVPLNEAQQQQQQQQQQQTERAVAVATESSSFLCEPALAKEFCPDALNGGAEKCLTCAFEHYQKLKPYSCTQDIVKSVCNATDDEFNKAVAPYADQANTDCSYYRGNCGSCISAQSYWLYSCFYCYMDGGCRGVGSSGNFPCNDAAGDYACVARSSFSSCQCYWPDQDDDYYTPSCSYTCPRVPTSSGLTCLTCEYFVQYMIDNAGSAVCGALCTGCCGSVPPVYAGCNFLMDKLGGCDYIQNLVLQQMGYNSACEICKELSGSGCYSCAPSTTKAFPWRNSTIKYTPSEPNSTAKANNIKQRQLALANN